MHKLTNSIGVVALLITTQIAVAQCDTGGTVPVKNAPYSAVRRVITTVHNTDGTDRRSEETQLEGRDSSGRTYRAGERRWTTVVNGHSVEMSETLVRFSDPVAKTDTTWDTTNKEAKVFHYSASATRANIEAFSFDAIAKRLSGTKLASKTIEGLFADGVRYEGKDSTHECWFSPDLQIMILQTDDYLDHRFENRLEHVVRGEPDLSNYKPPSGYHVRDIY